MSKTTIPTGGLADSAVTTAKITDGTIATADIADSAVTAAKTSGVATDLQAVADGSAGSPSIANSGDTNTGLFFPAADRVGITTAGNLNTTFLGDSSPQQMQFNHSGGGDGITLFGPGGDDPAVLLLSGYEAKGTAIEFFQDQGDDAGDKWSFMYGDASNGNVGADDGLRWAQFGNSSWDTELKLNQNGVLSSEGAMNASTTVDYAEYFEWKTELANDAKITETYGMTVVLDGDKVRLAEAGEEAKVLGVVRPNHTSAIVGGAQIFRYKDKYERNVWGEIQYENYTTCNWIKDGIRYSHAKDMLPDDAPKTDEEKLAVNYEERTTYRKDKGKHKKGDLLMRMKIKDSFDSTKTYIPREDRRKEWCIVGLLGQVPIRDSAVIPTSWTKMKNLESGIDLYYIK